MHRGTERLGPDRDLGADVPETDDEPRRPVDLAEVVRLPSTCSPRSAVHVDGLLEVVEHGAHDVLRDRDPGDV